MELTPEQESQLDDLQDPDEITNTDKYRWDEEFQREILAMLITDRPFLIEARALIIPIYFTNEIHSKICSLTFDYFEKYSAIPNKTQLNQIVRDYTSDKSDEVKMKYIGELNNVYSYYVPGAENRDYYRDRVTNFAKTQSMKLAFHKCLEEIKKDPENEKTWISVQEILKTALLTDKNFDLGLDYFADIEERYKRREESKVNNEVFSSGFKAIDSALKNGGLLRGELGSWVGLSGSGKSLCLVHAAISNLNLGKKVLYISLEIDQDAVAERFDAQIADPTNSKGLAMNNLVVNKDIVFEGIKSYIEEYDDKQRLVVRQFPGGSMGVTEFRSYLSQISMRGFRPDLVIIDYLGEMKDYPGIPTHESRYRITRDLRGLAVEEGICILTAMQPNRSAKEVIRLGEMIDDDNLGDSYAQIKPVDAMWSVNQSTEEKECSVARGFVIKHREGKSRFGFHIQFDYSKLKLTQMSQEKYEKIMRDYRMNKQITVSEKLAQDASVDKFINSKNTKKGLEELGRGFAADMEDEGPESPDES